MSRLGLADDSHGGNNVASKLHANLLIAGSARAGPTATEEPRAAEPSPYWGGPWMPYDNNEGQKGHLEEKTWRTTTLCIGPNSPTSTLGDSRSPTLRILSETGPIS